MEEERNRWRERAKGEKSEGGSVVLSWTEGGREGGNMKEGREVERRREV